MNGRNTQQELHNLVEDVEIWLKRLKAENARSVQVRAELSEQIEKFLNNSSKEQDEIKKAKTVLQKIEKMKTVIIAVLCIAMVFGQSPLETATAILNNNPCYQKTVMSTVLSLAENMMILQQTQDFSILDTVMTQVAQIKSSYEACQINYEFTANDWIENTGIAFLLASQCF